MLLCSLTLNASIIQHYYYSECYPTLAVEDAQRHRFFCEPAGPSNATVEQQRATAAAAPAQTVRCSVSLQRLTDTGKLKTLLYWLITIACLYMFPAVPSVRHT